MSKASGIRARKALDAFRAEVDWNLACGALADHDLPVTSDDGDHVVVVALTEEPLSILLGRLRAVGGYANLFVKGAQGVRMVSVIKDDCAISNPDEDMTPPAQRPGANATVGIFLDYLKLRPNGVRLSMVNPAQPPVARDSQNVEFATL